MNAPQLIPGERQPTDQPTNVFMCRFSLFSLPLLLTAQLVEKDVNIAYNWLVSNLGVFSQFITIPGAAACAGKPEWTGWLVHELLRMGSDQHTTRDRRHEDKQNGWTS